MDRNLKAIPPGKFACRARRNETEKTGFAVLFGEIALKHGFNDFDSFRSSQGTDGSHFDKMCALIQTN